MRKEKINIKNIPITGKLAAFRVVLGCFFIL